MNNFPVYIFLFIFVNIFASSVFPAMWFGPANMNHLGGTTGVCYESKYQLGYMKHGQERTVHGHCVNVVCSGYDSSITYMGCGKFECEDGQIDGDHSLQYPWCCPICID